MGKQRQKRRWVSIRGKLLTGYLAMVIIVVLLSMMGVNSIYRVYSNGSTIYYNHMRAVEYLKSVSQNLREIDRNLVILCTGAGQLDDTEYLFSIMVLQNENERLLHAYEKLTLTESEHRRYKQCCLSVRSFNRQVEQVLKLTEQDAQQQVYAIYEQELIPIEAVAFELIDAAVELSLYNAEKRNIDNHKIFMNIIIAACALCLCGIGTAIAIAFFMSNYFTRRFDSIRELARRMGAYDISNDLKEMPEDELGETMRALNDSQFMIRDFVAHIVSETQEMNDMGNDISKAVRKVREQLQKESVCLADNNNEAQLLAEFVAIAANDALPQEERQKALRQFTKHSDQLRESVEDSCSQFAAMATYLEQIAVTSDHQNEILANHCNKISRFKTGNPQ